MAPWKDAGSEPLFILIHVDLLYSYSWRGQEGRRHNPLMCCLLTDEGRRSCSQGRSCSDLVSPPSAETTLGACSSRQTTSSPLTSHSLEITWRVVFRRLYEPPPKVREAYRAIRVMYQALASRPTYRQLNGRMC